MRYTSKILAAVAGIACTASLVVAAEKTILGSVFAVKAKPGDPTSRKLSAKAAEKGSPNTIVGDPTLTGSVGGAFLEVTLSGGSPSSQTFTLAQGTSGNGKPFWTASSGSFVYKDAKGLQGPVKAIVIKESNGTFAIKAAVNGKNGTVNLFPPNPGTSACVALKLGISAGAGDRYSIQFGPDSQITNSGDTLFRAKKPSSEGVCP